MNSRARRADPISSRSSPWIGSHLLLDVVL